MRIDAVQTIKDRLTMRDVLERYGYTAKRRIPCPLHGGDGYNFEVKEKSYCCHSRCGGGDVISFVQKLFDLSFTETLRKIDADFGLNIYGDHTFEELRKAKYQQMVAKAKQDREHREKEDADREFWEAFDEWKRLDDNYRAYKPKSADEDPHPLFLESLQKLQHQKYILDTLTERRNKGNV